jgi:hypothetical protein
MAESFRKELQQRWDQGCQNRTGSYTGLLRVLAEWRPEKTAVVQPSNSTPNVVAMRHVSPQEGAALLSKPRTMLNERQTRVVSVDGDWMGLAVHADSVHLNHAREQKAPAEISAIGARWNSLPSAREGKDAY